MPDDPINQVKEDLGVASAALADARRELEELTERSTGTPDLDTDRSGAIDLSGGGGAGAGGSTDD